MQLSAVNLMKGASVDSSQGPGLIRKTVVATACSLHRVGSITASVQ